MSKESFLPLETSDKRLLNKHLKLKRCKTRHITENVENMQNIEVKSFY